MLWQGAKWRILKNFNVQNEECHNYVVNIPPTINASTFVNPVGEYFQIPELEFPVKSSEKILQLVTFFRQKDETLKMFYKRLLKLKEDIQNITDLEAAHWYICSLEGTLTFHE